MENPDTTNNGLIRSPVAFFLMPVDILKGIHEELSDLLGSDTASKILYNCGFRSGKNIVKDMNIEFPDLETLSTTLPELWLQMGIGVFNIEKLDNEHVVLKCEESNEAAAMGYTGRISCDLTSGYLAGMISTIFGNEFSCEEKSCISHGNTHCIFDLKISKE